MEYLVHRARVTPEMQGKWDGPAWKDADVAAITHFHAQSSTHRPQVRMKMQYDDRGLYLIFDARDRYVLCRRTEPQTAVCKDSCVEAFLQPKADKGYFNSEVNCGGAMLLFYVTDPTRINGAIKSFEPVALELREKIRIYHSMPRKIDNEIDQPTDWRVEYFVPNEVFEVYVGPLGAADERRWRGNFYKCADESSHPHWGSWAPIGEALNFHVPDYFGSIRFG